MRPKCEESGTSANIFEFRKYLVSFQQTPFTRPSHKIRNTFLFRCRNELRIRALINLFLILTGIALSNLLCSKMYFTFERAAGEIKLLYFHYSTTSSSSMFKECGRFWSFEQSTISFIQEEHIKTKFNFFSLWHQVDTYRWCG